jgi:hypothetical protein
MTTDLDLNNHKIIGLSDAIEPTDAVNLSMINKLIATLSETRAQVLSNQNEINKMKDENQIKIAKIDITNIVQNQTYRLYSGPIENIVVIKYG